MKKICISLFTLVVICTATTNAQGYKTAAGLQLDFGNGSTLVGPAIKYFFKENNALEGEILFGSGVTYLNAFYQYQKEIPNAKGLEWYLGGGPSFAFFSGATRVFLRPMVGLDYKLGDVPLALSFDWRPSIYLGSTYGSRFAGGRFGLGFKYVIN